MDRVKQLFQLDRWPPLATAAFILLIWVVFYLPLLEFSVSDYILHVKPWLDYIRANGGFAALGDDFSEYAPPYLYLLAAFSYFDFPFNDQVLVKLLNVPFILIVSYSIFSVCRHFNKSRNYAFAMGAFAVVLPTLGVNAFVWGQADLLYTSFLSLCVVCVLKERPYWAVALFAASLSIKLQSMFLAPFILCMVFAGRIPWKAAFVAPLVYIGSLVPALIAGRPLSELLQVYLVQGRYYNRLSFNAGNPYFILDFFYHASRNWDIYRGVTVLGLALSSVVGGLISLAGVAKEKMSDRAILLLATFSVTLMPYVLPKMHDRYFIVSDMMCFLLFCIDRRFWWMALAMQVSSLLSFSPEFSAYVLGQEIHDPRDWGWAVLGSMVINGAVIIGLARALTQELKPVWDWRGIVDSGLSFLGPLNPKKTRSDSQD
ncbi:MAG: DUF2029 domain-containing protein [Henriciella sp.]|nr:DUF2029 domain-containing protein [Henriciella sp.]